MPEHIEAPSPAQRGPYKIRSLTYGSGSDRHRPEYGEDAALITKPVNGLPFIDNWDGFSGWWREKYWGFDSRSLPLNARVWYPEGDGPFPLVLVVHGNHGMQDYSDPGYDYLGELLASKGMILASVDENFINGSWSDLFGGLDEENDARGWLLLEHLRIWHEWNQEPGHEFYGKVDTANLALIGHSRGGEAVAHAALFNALPYYPDDASQKFDYGFALQSIVAIAPVDGQYEPGESRTAFKNVNYLVLHGSQDADVTSYMGSQQYERIHFDDSLYHFKAGLYVYGANHGQFNTSWGDNDRFATFTGLINLKQLLPAEEQERIAEVYIGGFLDATLKDKTEYLPLFLDARRGRDWLPETLYLNQFEDSSFEPLATFDEDFDLSSLTEDGATARADNLTVWREQEVELKWQQKGSRGLFLGWHYDLEHEEMEDVESEIKAEAEMLAALPDSSIAQYSMRLPSFAIDSTQAFVFSMAESTEASDPKSKGKWVENEEEEKEDDKDVKEDKNEDEEDIDEAEENEEEAPDPPLDMTIQLTDSLGHEIAFPLSRFSPLQREIEVKIMKTDWIAGESESEKVFQTFYFPFTDLSEMDPEFDLGSIQEITFRFDRSKKGVIVIDQIGLMKSLEE
jgi:dienelactone hydrolase